jgi:hypothetical protein
MKFEIWVVFRKSVQKTQLSFKSYKNDWNFTWRPISIFYHNSLHSSSNEKLSDKIYSETRDTRFKFNHFVPPKIVSWYNVEKYCIPGQTTDDLMTHAHFTLGTYGYKHTLRIYNPFFFFTATMVARKRLNVTLYVHYMPCISDAQSILQTDATKCWQLIPTLTNRKYTQRRVLRAWIMFRSWRYKLSNYCIIC